MLLDWALKNQNLASAMIMFGGTTVWCTAIVVFDSRKGTQDVKNDAAETRRYFEEQHDETRRLLYRKFAELKDDNMATQRLILTCASSTMKGFQGNTAEIENFVKSVEVFEKRMGCVKDGGC